MSQGKEIKFESVLDEAKAILAKRVIIPRRYIEALYLTQLFEILLENIYSSLVKKGAKYFVSIGLDYKPEKRDDWTIKNYLNRLKTFFPSDKYKPAYEKLTKAMQKRNDFIHKCFKIKKEGIYGISLDKERMHLDKNALEKVDEWIKAYYDSVEPVIISLMLGVRRAKET